MAISKGIPYAAPPVGELRWKAPQPVNSWKGVKECTDFGPSVIQAPQAPFMMWSKEFIIDTSKGYSEDCLNLNVWSETESATDKRPVIVYMEVALQVEDLPAMFMMEKLLQKKKLQLQSYLKVKH